ncbi:MAG: dephospho-CoA kinase [Nitrospinae bacterium RIFCSPLOWO2_02_39_17]|nr:MAG: dephospho-CoA kinase [Nitrospinae bacterium RIFCSPHIGHO2_02_39_11]OGV98878.1 MAG: dephospho-CoA kinase [Nitrospinae bacterium RIFCSPHIGHO2_12_FULL_39_42]OGW01235.1 MAG: dephospho-CoA kinase [Nitrospinae bacterium RIFCSPHIGHO2_02_FULL_39_82]OGW06459.1 MAG: dephospho-CoA kinase [Nitrospinae bacterium RIFCSPLOWO2_02_39_17]OGW09185.1 MAG: dephospho-CoA kinase [Nitrospinae bacterium RIFCSPLOWO2_12_39_15]OGW09426.1 MAG: dephospho-CoA kinase [Nitrospinae bacterium RIFCSPLOWO2_12_FULL_39_93]
MLLIGLTGGMATGKSLVSTILKELGAFIIDADKISREIVEPDKPAWFKIVEFFGRDILNSDMIINRKRLGEIVFNDPLKKKRLEEIIHPLVIEEENRRVEDYKRLNPDGMAVIDAALLIEAGGYRRVDKLIVVYADRKTQLRRLMERDRLKKEEAEKRIDSQLPLDEKVKMADFVVDNSASKENTVRQVMDIFSKLKSLKTAVMKL